MATYSVTRSRYIATVEEARDYYVRKMAKAHRIECHGRAVTVAFEASATHLFTIEAKPGITGEIVRRRLGGGRVEERIFDLARAQAMDAVLPAVARYTVSVPGTGPNARASRLLHGPRMLSGSYMRVVLRPGPGTAFTCISAYAVPHATWMEMRRAKSARFPP